MKLAFPELDAVRDEVVSFAGLHGILTRGPRTKHPIGVILLNAGLLRSVGPYRLSVDLARAFTGAGVISLRFDLSGLGDSPRRVDKLSDQERAALEIREAMSFLERELGIRKFVLIGLCSGAYHAHQVAAQDERVAGAVFLDGYSYPTPEHHVVRLARLPRQVLRRAQRVFRGRGPSPAISSGETYVVEFPKREKFLSDLERLAARGAQLFFVYSGGVPCIYNYTRQFWDLTWMVDLRGCAECVYLPNADHTFSRLKDRRDLVQRIQEWFQGRDWSSQKELCHPEKNNDEPRAASQ